MSAQQVANKKLKKKKNPQEKTKKKTPTKDN